MLLLVVVRISIFNCKFIDFTNYGFLSVCVRECFVVAILAITAAAAAPAAVREFNWTARANRLCYGRINAVARVYRGESQPRQTRSLNGFSNAACATPFELDPIGADLSWLIQATFNSHSCYRGGAIANKTIQMFDIFIGKKTLLTTFFCLCTVTSDRGPVDFPLKSFMIQQRTDLNSKFERLLIIAHR